MNKEINILFQGDSITECTRMREKGDHKLGLGSGYVNLIGAQLMCDYPNIKVYNRGINGNRIVDMYARWTEDALNIPFDVLSILNGVNDIGFGLRLNRGADSQKFGFIYDRILYETKKAKPDALIVLCEPFLVKFLCEGSKDIYHDWEIWYSTLKERGAIVKELSQKYNTVFVPLLQAFENALKIAPEEHWTCDAIHPSHAGHELIKREWLKAVLPKMKEKGLLN